MKTRRALFAALILLTTALACVVPGLSAASVPAPTVDTRLNLMVAETVSAAIEQTALVVPTITASASPTPQPTVTSTPVINEAGSTLTSHEDGNSLFFVDEHAGYEVVIPANWLAVRINQQEYFTVLALGDAADPNIQKSVLSIKDQDPATFRLLALDVAEGHIKNEIVTNINFIWDQQSVISFDNDEDLQKIADELPASVQGLTVSSVEVVIIPSSVMYGVITSEVGGFNASGAQVTLFQKMVFFNLKTGALVITFTTETGLTETTLPIFDAMLETIKLNLN